MVTLAHTTSYDFETGLARLWFHGDLDMVSAAKIRSAMLKTLSEHPLAVIVNLDDLEILQELALLVLPALVHNREDVPILLCCDPISPTGIIVRAASLGGMLIYAHEREASAVLAKGRSSSKRAHVLLRPTPAAPAVARRLVVRLCEAWDLEIVTEVAELIISELVTNAVRHAGTDIEVTAAIGEHFLHLHVRDRSKQLPTLSGADGLQTAHRRGLQMVDRLSNGWGTTLTAYGKTVWATLRLTPPAPPR
ncbi:STAS domain-containing protein [Rhizocola hellebori]|uniref:STAS domain-containing protein n=1 Tax=Rhizocola hellebori TaxID=1392758 RepID=A0A8J3VIC4_9ACTN|nr:ATP-binding protein [Rhizocola hellebori]GIH06778.1 STAS domain-containing protein [Rhizocola hellebori]